MDSRKNIGKELIEELYIYLSCLETNQYDEELSNYIIELINDYNNSPIINNKELPKEAINKKDPGIAVK